MSSKEQLQEELAQLEKLHNALQRDNNTAITIDASSQFK